MRMPFENFEHMMIFETSLGIISLKRVEMKYFLRFDPKQLLNFFLFYRSWGFLLEKINCITHLQLFKFYHLLSIIFEGSDVITRSKEKLDMWAMI
jgi:hypothetical protein